jgi:hypothetical protein
VSNPSGPVHLAEARSAGFAFELHLTGETPPSLSLDWNAPSQPRFAAYDFEYTASNTAGPWSGYGPVLDQSTPSC